jgi:hypothetical protein
MFFRSGLLADLNNDGTNEFVFSVTSYPNQVKIPLTVIGDQNGALNLTSQYFPNGAPAVMHSPYILYQDINGDGKKDIIAAEAGLDQPPWTGSKIGVAINNGGTFTNVSSLISDTTTRSYSIAVGNFNGDGRMGILLPNNYQSGASSSLLEFANNSFAVLPNPIQPWVSKHLDMQASMVTADFNGDGYDDLLIGGGASARFTSIIIYGGIRGLDVSTLNQLPSGPYGQATDLGGADTNSISFDFNHDGRPDIFSIGEHTVYFPPGTVTDRNIPTYDTLLRNGGTFFENSAFQTLTNVDGYRFGSTIPAASNLGLKGYFDLTAIDINRDGNTDVLGHYYTKSYGSLTGQLFGTTFFLNDGRGNFTVVDAVDVFPQLVVRPYSSQQDNRPEVGLIIPLRDDAGGFTGLQLLPAPGNTGQFTIQEFSTNQMTNLVPDPVSAADGRIMDRAGSAFITTSAGNDTIYDTNSWRAANAGKLAITFAAEHINATAVPNISILVNGQNVVAATPITALHGTSAQDLQIDVGSFGPITSLEIDIGGTTYIDATHRSDVQIYSLTYGGLPISLGDATYSSGSNYLGGAASMNGTIKFAGSVFQSAALGYLAHPDIVDGGAGIDTSAYSGAKSQYQIMHNSSGTWSVTREGQIADMLTNVERLQFSDTRLALDLDANAGIAAKVLGAVFGPSSVSNRQFVGLGLHLLDGGMSYSDLMSAALNAAGAATHQSVVNCLWTSLFGSAPTAAQAAPIVSLLDSGVYTAASLGILAADTDLNKTNINLVGLHQTGLEYL